MSDDALIRLENLRSLGKTAAELRDSVGHSYQYWRDLLDGKKSFGEKAARNIEEKLQLPRGCLDDIEGLNGRENTLLPATDAARRLLSDEAVFLGQRLDRIQDDVVKGDALSMALQVLQDHYRTWKNHGSVEKDSPGIPHTRMPHRVLSKEK